MSEIQKFKKGGPVKKSLPQPGSSPSVVKTPQPKSTPSVIGVTNKTPSASQTKKNLDANLAKLKQVPKTSYNDTSKKTKTVKKLDNSENNNNNNAGGGSGFGSFSLAPAPQSEPFEPERIVKVPERDVVDYTTQGLNAQVIANLLFENVGANELIKFERHDTVEGTNERYQIISNLSDINRKFDPASLTSRQKPNTSYFDRFNIRLQGRIPDANYLAERGLTDFIYIDSNGDLVVELDNIGLDEVVELEIDAGGTIYLGDQN